MFLCSISFNVFYLYPDLCIRICVFTSLNKFIFNSYLGKYWLLNRERLKLYNNTLFPLLKIIIQKIQKKTTLKIHKDIYLQRNIYVEADYLKPSFNILNYICLIKTILQYGGFKGNVYISKTNITIARTHWNISKLWQ